jgi:hypothetical protein
MSAAVTFPRPFLCGVFEVRYSLCRISPDTAAQATSHPGPWKRKRNTASMMARERSNTLAYLMFKHRRSSRYSHCYHSELYAT